MSDPKSQALAAQAQAVESVADLGKLFAQMIKDNSQNHSELKTLIETSAKESKADSDKKIQNLRNDMIAEMNHRNLNMWWNFQQEKDVEKCIYFYDEPKNTTPDGRGRKDHTQQGLNRVYELIGGNSKENLESSGFKECWIEYVTRFAQNGNASRRSNYGSKAKFDTIRVIFVHAAYANLLASIGRKNNIDGFRIGQTITQQKMYKHSKMVCTKLNDDPHYNAKHKVRNYMPVFAGYKDDVEDDDKKYQKPPTSLVYDPLFFLPNDRKAGHTPPVKASIPRTSYTGPSSAGNQPGTSSNTMGIEGLANSGIPLNAAELAEFRRFQKFKNSTMTIDDEEYSIYLEYTRFLDFHNKTNTSLLSVPDGNLDAPVPDDSKTTHANKTPITPDPYSKSENPFKRLRPQSSPNSNDDVTPANKYVKIVESPSNDHASKDTNDSKKDNDASCSSMSLSDSQVSESDDFIKPSQDSSQLAENEAEKIYKKLMAKHAKMDHKAKKWDIINLDMAEKCFVTLIHTEIVNKLAEAQEIRNSGKNAPKRLNKLAEEIESDLEILAFLERGCSVLGTGTVKPPIAGAMIFSAKEPLGLSSEQIDHITIKVNQIFEMKDSPRTYIMKVSEASQNIAEKYAKNRPVPRTKSKLKKKA